MKKAKLKILSTRILNRDAIDKASLQNIEIDELPFISTEAVKDEELKKRLKGFLQENITAVFTSKNAVLAFEQIVNANAPWTIFCIGQATKKAVAKLFGEENISGTADNAANLSEVILKDGTTRKVIFFCGEKRRDELPEKLKTEGIELEEITVYQTTETPQKISRKSYDGILFFSPSAVKSFFSLNKINEQTQIFAIGNTTANAIKEYINRELIIAEKPGEENIIDEVISYFSTTKTV